MFKIRVFKEHNYKAIFDKGRTIRVKGDANKPITQLKYPEFYDVKITNYCTGGCEYCYQNSTVDGEDFSDIVNKTKLYFGSMTKNERPFQAVLGGGNPNQHVDFIELLKTYVELGIVPNYTTNGIGLTKDILDATKKYCEGVAISCHPHLEYEWRNSVKLLTKHGIKTNLHIIISDKGSIDRFKSIQKEFNEIVHYFLLLPYMEKGRAKYKSIDYRYLEDELLLIPDNSKIAFGANFYEFLKKSKLKNTYDLSLYTPEILSAFLDMSNMKLFESSFSLVER